VARVARQESGAQKPQERTACGDRLKRRGGLCGGHLRSNLLFVGQIIVEWTKRDRTSTASSTCYCNTPAASLELATPPPMCDARPRRAERAGVESRLNRFAGPRGHWPARLPMLLCLSGGWGCVGVRFYCNISVSVKQNRFGEKLLKHARRKMGEIRYLGDEPGVQPLDTA
jgi:hypothetical protein